MNVRGNFDILHAPYFASSSCPLYQLAAILNHNRTKDSTTHHNILLVPLRPRSLNRKLVSVDMDLWHGMSSLTQDQSTDRYNSVSWPNESSALESSI